MRQWWRQKEQILEKDQEDGTRKFTLKMGGTTIAELGSDIEKAVCNWGAAFPALNVRFPARDPRAVCVMVYREVLGLDGGPKHSAKALALLSCLP